jgi:branched-chain amino acid transport system permease protein
MVYHRQLNAAMGAQLRFLGANIDTAAPLHWCSLGVLLLVAAGFFEWARQRFSLQWDAAQQAIEQARLQQVGEAP